VWCPWSREAQAMVNNVDRGDEKVACIERQLTLLLRKNRREPGIVAYCVGTLRSVDGRMSIRDLERPAIRGDISDRLFKQVGLSPQVLAEIFRFQRLYRNWAAGVSFDLLKAELYDAPAP
jgi:hypothetical protein